METKQPKKEQPKKKPCKHPNSYVRTEGMTGMCGRVVCPDCGYEREWNAY